MRIYLGTVLAHLLNQKPDYKYKVFVRKQDKAKLLNEINNVEAIIGDNNDDKVIQDVVKISDIVIHTSNSADDLPSTKSIIEGLLLRKQQDKSDPIYLHVSGTGELVADSKGKNDIVDTYSDNDSDHINSLPITAIHRDVDTYLLKYSDQLNIHIIEPSLIWGQANHDLVKRGISNKYSDILPTLARTALQRKQVGFIGPGENIWPNVEINERAWNCYCKALILLANIWDVIVADLFVLILDAAINGKIVSNSKGSYFFGANDHHYFKDVLKKLAENFAGHGIGKDSPDQLSDDEVKKYFGGYYLGSSGRAIATRSKSLGWNPKLGTKDLLIDIKDLSESILKDKNII